MRAKVLTILTSAALALLCPCPALATKTDILVLKNGDRITGEVKGLTGGKLDYNTDDAGRPSIEWVKVAHVRSIHSFEVQASSGLKYFGQLDTTEAPGMLVVRGASTDTLPIPSVVEVYTLDAGFLQRVKAYLDLGFTYAKANQATTFNSSGEAAYRGDRFGSTINFDSYAQGQESVPTTTRNSVGAQVTRFLPHRWSALLIGRTEQNDELNLDLRVTGAAALGRVLSQSNSADFGAGVGLAVTRERFSAADDSTNGGTTKSNLEGLVAGRWDAYRFDSPKLDFSTSLYLYPSLTSFGRVRGEFSLRVKYELFKDFNVGVSGTDTFDSDPPEESATKNDLVTTFTIGWSYRR
ncbi:MAG: DUF481 domain-containing protein [Candidatus Eiseniibacteriota bacterium]